jgi:PmbA protein
MELDSRAKAQQLLNLAKQFGIQFVEIYQLQTRSRMACFDANMLKQVEYRESSGLALRVWLDDRLGLAVTHGSLDPEALLNQAIALSQLNSPHPPNHLSTQLCSPSLNRGTSVSQNQLIDWGKDAINEVLDEHGQCSCSAELSCESEEIYLVNSEGLECGYIDTTLRSFLTTEWIRGHDFLCIEANQTQRDRLNLNVLTHRIQQSLKWSARRVSAPKGSVPILFTPNATEVLWDTVQAALNGQKVVDEISPWAYQLEQVILSPKLTLTQRPNVGPFSCPFDDEGMPSRHLEFVRNGQLQAYFTDQKHGLILGSGSTGNGFRPNLDGYPVPELINLVVNPGAYSFEEMVQQMDDGLIVDQVLGETRRISGDLSFNVDLGYRVQKGEIRGRVKDTLISGNVYKALNQVIALGNDHQWNDIYYSPSLLVSGFSIVA